MEGAMATLLNAVVPAYYKEFIYIDICGKEFMYAEAKKDIYCTIEAPLPFCTKLSKSLE